MDFCKKWSMGYVNFISANHGKFKLKMTLTLTVVMFGNIFKLKNVNSWQFVLEKRYLTVQYFR